MQIDRNNEHLLRFMDPEDAKRYLLGGLSFVTVLSQVTGTRFTFKVAADTDRYSGAPLHWVRVLTGPDNTSDYTYLGRLNADGTLYQNGRGVGAEAPSSVAFRYLWWCLNDAHQIPDKMEVWHPASCGKCAQLLTVDSSIKLGFGPKCADDLGVGNRLKWHVVTPDGQAYTCSGAYEAHARAELRDILGVKRLPKGVVCTAI